MALALANSNLRQFGVVLLLLRASANWFQRAVVAGRGLQIAVMLTVRCILADAGSIFGDRCLGSPDDVSRGQEHTAAFEVWLDRQSCVLSHGPFRVGIVQSGSRALNAADRHEAGAARRLLVRMGVFAIVHYRTSLQKTSVHEAAGELLV